MLTPIHILTSGIPKQTAVLLASVHDKSFDDLSKVMLKADKQSLTDTLQTAFQDLAKTEWGGQTDVPAFYGQAEKLAALYRAQGTGVSQAADQAFAELVSSRYVIADKIRIPLPFAAVESALPAAKDDAVGLADMSHLPPGVSPEDARRWYGRMTEWRTLPDDRGLILMEGQRVVRDAGGRSVVRSWRELTNMPPPPRELGTDTPSIPGLGQ